MFEVLKIIHFLSFSVAIGAGVSNLVLGTRLASFPPQAMPPLGGFRLLLGKLSTIGLVLLWLTGLSMIASANGMAVNSTLFALKITAVVGLTILSIIANMTVAKAKKVAAPPDANLMKRLGLGSQAFAILALMLAVFAFA